MKRTDPRQDSLGWKSAAPAALPPEVAEPADSKAVRSLEAFKPLRWTKYDENGKPNPKPEPSPLPCYVRLLDEWAPAEAIGFYYDDPTKQTGARVTVRIIATGSRLTIRSREYILSRGGDA